MTKKQERELLTLLREIRDKLQEANELQASANAELRQIRRNTRQNNLLPLIGCGGVRTAAIALGYLGGAGIPRNPIIGGIK